MYFSHYDFIQSMLYKIWYKTITQMWSLTCTSVLQKENSQFLMFLLVTPEKKRADRSLVFLMVVSCLLLPLRTCSMKSNSNIHLYSQYNNAAIWNEALARVMHDCSLLFFYNLIIFIYEYSYTWLHLVNNILIVSIVCQGLGPPEKALPLKQMI